MANDNQIKQVQQLSVMISEMTPGEVFPISMRPEVRLAAVSMQKAFTYFVEHKMANV